MDYLLDYIIDSDITVFELKQKFVRDRTRAIRQDSVLQQQHVLSNEENLASIIKIHEEIARFHIISNHRLCESTIEEFNPFQNTEQLRKVLQSLHEYYNDCRRIYGPRSMAIFNEPEFRSYQLLTHAEDQDVVRESLSFDALVFSSPQVQFALDCVSALHQCDYVRFFRLLIRSSYTQACLLHTHFQRVRMDAIARIQKSHTRGAHISAIDLARWLAIEEYAELDDLSSHCGLFRLSTSSTGTSAVFDELQGSTRSSKYISRKSLFIESKISGRPLSEIIRGDLSISSLSPQNQVLPSLLSIPRTLSSTSRAGSLSKSTLQKLSQDVHSVVLPNRSLFYDANLAKGQMTIANPGVVAKRIEDILPIATSKISPGGQIDRHHQSFLGGRKELGEFRPIVLGPGVDKDKVIDILLQKLIETFAEEFAAGHPFGTYQSSILDEKKDQEIYRIRVIEKAVDITLDGIIRSLVIFALGDILERLGRT